ncbi:hypothetical protein [Paraflavitalea soli]|uniref:hypothetical protein n=1 Tax=Paraflavitalea soli TaxID=2315862 RepID=UPI001B8698D6|nr:hypothetical protein [Paraflavitalea soli]
MTVKDLHREAMKFNDLALIAKQNNDVVEIKNNYLKAFEFEKQAFILFNSESSEEPTRSVLLRSAANLAMLSEQLREAEKLISIGLAGDPPNEIADEFRDLLQQVNFFRHLELHGIVLNSNELQLSLSGNQVGHGLIRSDEFLNRIEIVERMAFRTADRIRNKPFNDKGRPLKNNVINFEPYLSIPRAASFAVTIRFGQSTDQQVFAGMDVQSQLIDDILKNIKLINEENYSQLAENIKDESYRRNFIALTKQLAPDGDRIKLVGFTTTNNFSNKTIALTKISKEVQVEATSKDSIDPVSKKEIEITGTLSFADSKKSKIKLTDSKNSDYEIEVPQGLLSDIVKPYFEETVIIRGTQEGKKIQLKDIEKVE